MKEMTYGWYPSVKDVYRPKGRPGSYHLECLYKHGESMYYQGPADPPQPELFVRGINKVTPPPTPQEYRKSRSVPVPKFRRVPKLHIPTPIQCWSTHANNLTETKWGVVGDHTYRSAPTSDVSWPLPKGKKKTHQAAPDQHHYQKFFQKQLLQQHIQQQQQKHDFERQSPQYAWGFQPAAQDGPPSVRSEPGGSELAWPKAHKPSSQKSSRPHTAHSGRQETTIKLTSDGHKQRPSSSPVKLSTQGQRVMAPAPPAAGRPVSPSRTPRIQSASVRREKTPLPPRPVTANTTKSENYIPLQIVDPSQPSGPQPLVTPPSRPCAPVPFIYDVEETWERGQLQEEEGEEEMPTDEVIPYETILDKYGWRAEVHGDPYKLKRPMKRVSYAVECPEPEVMPEPPGVHMETNEPFFLNTIPHKPLSFAVHKEWMSEVLVAKRQELQKREGGVKYKYKNFAFVY